MSEVEILLVVVAAIYLSECVAWLPSQSLVLTGLRNRLSRAAAPDVLGNEKKQLFLLHLLPSSTTLVTRRPDHFFHRKSLLLKNADGGWHQIPYQQIDRSTVRADGRVVVIGEHRIRTCSRKASQQHTKLIQRLVDSSEPDAVVSAFIDRTTDPHRAARRVHILQERVSVLAQLQFMLVAWILCAGSILYYYSADPWDALVKYLLITFFIWMATIVTAWRCSRKLYGRSGSSERWKEMLLSLVSPMHAARSTDHLSLNVLGNEHPLCVAIATMQKQQLQPFARQMLAELRHPLATEQIVAENSTDTLAALCESRRSLADALCVSLRDRDTDTDSLMRPDQQDNGATCWCPRCFSQFTIDMEQCPDCDGVAVRKFIEETATNEELKQP